MGKRRYTMRFYRQHDIDLITFILTHEFNVSSAVYSVVSAFAKGELFVVDIPPERDVQVPELRRIYTWSLFLDEEKDAAAVELLAKVKDGYRNNFLKNLMRQYLCCPASAEFLVDRGDMPGFYEKFRIFRDGKKTARAGKVQPAARPSLEKPKHASGTKKKEAAAGKPVPGPAQDPDPQQVPKPAMQPAAVESREAGSDENELLSFFKEMLG